MSRILVVEDNDDLAAGIQHNLRLEGHDVQIARDGPAAIAAVESSAPDLVLLDLMLPGVDGYSVLEHVRRGARRVPVIILSAKGEDSDRVRAFRLDADHYVTKPFSVLELLERVAALLRRSTREQHTRTLDALEFGDICVDLRSRVVTRAGRPVSITPKAYDLLLALARRKERVASRGELLREVWGYSPFVMTRTVDSHIAELRRKLDDTERPRHFVTVWKAGYRFIAQD